MTGYVGSIETEAMKNGSFRQVLFTGQHAQHVVMRLQPGAEIGREMHPDVDQFFRLEQGEVRFTFSAEESRVVRGGDPVMVPAGTCHIGIDPSTTDSLQLYTLYAPPNGRSSSSRSRLRTSIEL